MADVLPPKRQIAVDRLRRRIESYRRHKINCIPRFDQSFNDLCQQNIQDTLILKQRFLENKVKRAAKKAEKKQPENTLQSVHSVPKFVPPKRNASDDLDRNEGYNDPPPPKSQKPGPPPQAENVTKFAVEIIQQVEFTTTSSNSQISTNVTVKALNTSVKSDMGSGVQTSTVSPQPQPHTPRNDIVECKQEQEENPEFVDLEQCAAALEKDAAVNGGNSFPGFTDLIGDDTSDAIITSDAFKDLISEISDFHPEFMKDFDFDGGDSKKLDCIQQHVFKTEEVDSKTTPHHQQIHQQRNVMQGGVNQRMYSSGMDFSKTELSPAAQTLKQMAEQHQHKTQLGMNFNPASIPGNKTPYSEYQYNSGSDFGSPGGNNSNQSGYKQPGMVTPTPPSSYVNSDSIKQEVFSAQNSPGVYSPGSAGKSSSGQSQARLGAGFNQQYSPYSSPGAHGSPQYTPRGQSQGGPPPNQAPPRPPSCPGTTTLQINQAQQLHISQAQGTPIQVSMAQNLSTDMKPGAVSVAAQQGMYFSQSPLAPTQNNAGEAYCTVSQSQTINFTQQTLRQRAPPRGDKIMHPQMIRPQQPQPQQMGVRPPPPEYKASPTQPLFHPMASQRGFSPTRRVAQQPIPPSGPMMRPQQQQQQPSSAYMNLNINNPATHQRVQYARPQRPQPIGLNPEAISVNSPEWRHLILAQQQHQQQQQQQQQQQHQQQQQQQQRLPFHQAQGVAFSGGGVQMSAGQMQQLSHMNQQQSLALQQSNAQMSLNLHMSQSMGGRSQLPNNQLNTYVSSAPSVYSGYGNSNSFQHSSYPQLPSDLNLDFLEQLPTSDASHFSDHELLSSLESGASFNLQDIL